jgi:hypothetical protein
MDPIADLLKRWQEGDPRAAEELFARFAAELARLAQQHLSRTVRRLRPAKPTTAVSLIDDSPDAARQQRELASLPTRQEIPKFFIDIGAPAARICQD